jgi:hypothetical protein
MSILTFLPDALIAPTEHAMAKSIYPTCEHGVAVDLECSDCAKTDIFKDTIWAYLHREKMSSVKVEVRESLIIAKSKEQHSDR